MSAGKTIFVAGITLSLTACFYGDENDWATADQIVQAASRCGLKDFQPTSVGDAWAAWVPKTVAGASEKEDCIYKDLEQKGLLATR
jgi:hypothetical protein